MTGAAPDPSERRVLVADDVEAVRVSLTLALEEAGFAVTGVRTGAEALAALRGGGFEIAVLDLWMPDTDGLAVLRAIRKEQPYLRIFVITGGGPRLPLEAAVLMAEVWGAEQVILKPFDEAELIASIEKRAA